MIKREESATHYLIFCSQDTISGIVCFTFMLVQQKLATEWVDFALFFRILSKIYMNFANFGAEIGCKFIDLNHKLP